MGTLGQWLPTALASWAYGEVPGQHRGPDGTGADGETSRHDGRHGTESSAVQQASERGAGRLQEQIADRRQSPADHHELRVEGGHEVGDAEAEPPTDVGEHGPGFVVTGRRGR